LTSSSAKKATKPQTSPAPKANPSRGLPTQQTEGGAPLGGVVHEVEEEGEEATDLAEAETLVATVREELPLKRRRLLPTPPLQPKPL